MELCGKLLKLGNKAGKFCINRPELARNKIADFVFAVDNKACCNGLNATCGKTVANLLPEKGRELITDNSVEKSACLLSVYEIFIYVTGLLDALEDCVLCNFVKCNALCLFIIKLKEFFEMP